MNLTTKALKGNHEVTRRKKKLTKIQIQLLFHPK